jgi:hypothetical protein
MDILIQDFLEAVRERKNNNKMSQGREWRDRRHMMCLANLIKRGNLKRLRSIIGMKKALGTVLRQYLYPKVSGVHFFPHHYYSALASCSAVEILSLQ